MVDRGESGLAEWISRPWSSETADTSFTEAHLMGSLLGGAAPRLRSFRNVPRLPGHSLSDQGISNPC